MKTNNGVDIRTFFRFLWEKCSTLHAGWINYLRSRAFQIRSPSAMCDTNQTMKGSVISSSNSTQGGGALLIPGNHSAGFSSSLTNEASALHPTESPLPVTSVPKIHNVLLMGQFNYDVGPISCAALGWAMV